MNKSPHTSLTKTCSRCRLQKPLTAFLQFAGTGGAIYGNVCATCRKTDKNKKPGGDEGSSTSRLAYRIDAKAKTQSDLEKKLSREHIKELDQKDRQDKEVAKETRKEKTQGIAKKEQQHRKEMKKGLFSEGKAKTKALSTANAIALGKQFFTREERKKRVDYTKPVLDTHIAGQTKHHSAPFNALRAWLGKKNNLTTNIQKMGLDKKGAPSTTTKAPEKSEKPAGTTGPRSKKP